MGMLFWVIYVVPACNCVFSQKCMKHIRNRTYDLFLHICHKPSRFPIQISLFNYFTSKRENTRSRILYRVMHKQTRRSVLYPPPRNAIDSVIKPWKGARATDTQQFPMTGHWKYMPFGCDCSNGTALCEAGQSCFWFSQGCTSASHKHSTKLAKKNN